MRRWPRGMSGMPSIEELERPSTPAEAALHHDIKLLKLSAAGIGGLHRRLAALEEDIHLLHDHIAALVTHSQSIEQRLRDLESRRRKGDD
jgi:hypothetical protein